jgi:predicted exporter
VFYKAPKRRAAWGPRLGEWLARSFTQWRWTPARIAVFALLLFATLAGLFRLRLQDDVRALQSSPPELVAAEKRVAEVLRLGLDSRYFLVQSDSADGLLATESRLTPQLDALKGAGKLGSYTALSHALPPQVLQQQAHALLASNVFNPGGLLPATLTQLGYAPAAVEARRVAFDAGSTPLAPDEWLASAASAPYRDLWLGQLNGRYASIVTLSSVHDVPALGAVAAATPGARLIDRVQSVTDVLQSYRRAMSWLLCVVYVIAMGLLCLKFGWREAPLLLLPSALASAVTLGLFGWCGVPVNLFVLLALWLVLGLGVDYGIFLRHGRTALPTAVLSVSLSAVTTLLAFGMLAASSTPFIRSIGLTLLFAISFSWLFAMLSCLTMEPENLEPKQ